MENATQKILSIIIPVYNTSAYLEHSLSSICAQNFDANKVEVIIIDDGSTDNSGEISERFKAKDKCIKVFHKASGGVASARNMGLQYATGEYIAWLDSDDYLADDYGEKILSKLGNDYDVVIFDYAVQNANSTIEHYYKNKNGFISKNEIITDVYNDKKLKSYLWQFIIKREYIVCPFCETIKICEDLDVLYKYLVAADSFYYLHYILYYYVNRANSITHCSLGKEANTKICMMQIFQRRYEFLRNYGLDVDYSIVIAELLHFCRFYYKLPIEEQIKHQAAYADIKEYILKHYREALLGKMSFSDKKKLVLLKMGLLKYYCKLIG